MLPDIYFPGFAHALSTSGKTTTARLCESTLSNLHARNIMSGDVTNLHTNRCWFYTINVPCGDDIAFCANISISEHLRVGEKRFYFQNTLGKLYVGFCLHVQVTFKHVSLLLHFKNVTSLTRTFGTYPCFSLLALDTWLTLSGLRIFVKWNLLHQRILQEADSKGLDIDE